MTVKFDFSSLSKGFECTWPVRVPVPQDGGSIQEQEFTAVFRKLTKEEDEAATEATNSDNPYAWLDARFVGLVDEPLTPELRALMMRDPATRGAIITAYANFAQGVPAKN